MRSIRALIVDDEPLARERVRLLLAEHADVAVVGECEDGDEAVEAIRRERPDLVFLDVQMPQTDGFAVVREVGPERMPLVVFVTAYDQFALRAFEASALDYLLKPFAPERFRTALDRARARLADPVERFDARLAALLTGLQVPRAPELPERFVVRTGAQYLPVRADEIDWIEAADNYLRLHVGPKVHMLRETMSGMEERLDPRRFLRIHRSLIVNLDRVRAVETWGKAEYVVILQNGARLQSSRGYRDRIRSFLEQGRTDD